MSCSGSQSDSEDSSDDAPQNNSQTLTTTKIGEAFALIETANAIFSECDPLKERSAKVNRQIELALTTYRELYYNKKAQSKQITLDAFLLKSSRENVRMKEIKNHSVQACNKGERPKQISLIDYFSKSSNARFKSAANAIADDGNIFIVEDSDHECENIEDTLEIISSATPTYLNNNIEVVAIETYFQASALENEHLDFLATNLQDVHVDENMQFEHEINIPADHTRPDMQIFNTTCQATSSKESDCLATYSPNVNHIFDHENLQDVHKINSQDPDHTQADVRHLKSSYKKKIDKSKYNNM